MDPVNALVAEVVAAVQALGYRTVTSPNDINPPCVIVSPPSTGSLLNGGGLRMTIPVTIIGASRSSRDQTTINEWLPPVMAALGATEFDGQIYYTESGQPLPAYTIQTEGH